MPKERDWKEDEKEFAEEKAHLDHLVSKHPEILESLPAVAEQLREASELCNAAARHADTKNLHRLGQTLSDRHSFAFAKLKDLSRGMDIMEAMESGDPAEQARLVIEHQLEKAGFKVAGSQIVDLGNPLEALVRDLAEGGVGPETFKREDKKED